MTTDRFDIHAHITDRIVEGLETGGDWQRPWKGASGLPTNALTKNLYNGVNILALWVAAQLAGFGSSEWGTYRQWSELGAQVRKGSKASFVVFYKQIEAKAEAEGDDEPERRAFARATPVFNAEQVDGYATSVTIAPMAERLASADAFITATGAAIEHGGQPCYIAALDRIRMPHLEAFVGSATSSATETYYSTLFHELTHWTGPKHRADRDMTGRFGTQAYALEELVAELGSAFLSAQHGLTNEPRPDHAHYVANWLKVLKNDKRAVFTAASQASKAVAFLNGLASHQPQTPNRQPAETATAAPAP
jgi:antirestriction protein ArdC